MDARPTPVIARFLRTPDAAVHLGLSARTLEKHRCFGTGPVYRKLGGRIVYSLTDLDAWAEQGLRRSTSDPGKGVVHPAKRLDGYPAWAWPLCLRSRCSAVRLLMRRTLPNQQRRAPSTLLRTSPRRLSASAFPSTGSTP